MFSLFPTLAMSIGASFLLATGLITADVLDTKDDIVGEVADTVVTEEIASSSVVVVDEMLSGDTAGTTTESVVIGEENLNDVSSSTTTINAIEVGPTVVEYQNLDDSIEYQPSSELEDVAINDVSTNSVPVSVPVPDSIVVVEDNQVFDTVLENDPKIESEEDCFSADIRPLFINPGQCLREIRSILF